MTGIRQSAGALTGPIALQQVINLIETSYLKQNMGFSF
jgi:hypothetical protein